MGKGLSKGRYLLDIDSGRNINPAMTNINANLHKVNQIGIVEYWNDGILGFTKT